MFVKYLKDAGAEGNSIGTVAFFCDKDILQHSILKSESQAISTTLNPIPDDEEIEEISGNITVGDNSAGRWSITYSFYDNYLSEEIIDVIKSNNSALAKRTSCMNIESLLVIEWSVASNLVEEIEPIIDQIIENHEGVLFVDEVGLFDRSGFLLKITNGLYE